MSPAYERIHGALAPGEVLLWCGRPQSGGRTSGGGMLAVLLSIGVIGAILFGAVRNLAHGDTGGGLVFLAIVLLLLYGTLRKIIVDARRRSRTAYGLTDRRAIIVEGLSRKSALVLPLSSLSGIALRQPTTRSGTIVCFCDLGGWNKTTKRGEVLPRPLFRRIVDVRHVLDLLLDAQANQPARIRRSPSHDRAGQVGAAQAGRRRQVKTRKRRSVR